MFELNHDMDQQNLRALLEQLHGELAANPPTDERSRQLLLELQADIERTLPRAGASDDAAALAPPPRDLRERLQQTIAGFEGAHPQSAAALERVLVLLSNFGL